MEFSFTNTQIVPTFGSVTIGDWFIYNGCLYIKTGTTEAICISEKQHTNGFPKIFSSDTEVCLVTKVDIHFSK